MLAAYNNYAESLKVLLSHPDIKVNLADKVIIPSFSLCYSMYTIYTVYLRIYTTLFCLYTSLYITKSVRATYL